MSTQPTLKNITNGKFGVPPEKQNAILQELGAPHIDSFNYMTDVGLDQAIADIIPVEFELPNGERVSLQYRSVTLEKPLVYGSTGFVKDVRIFPTECRQRAATYKGKLMAEVVWSVDGIEKGVFVKDMGDIPIMVKSNRCHLNSLSPKQLVQHKEHEQEWGGYFIISGHERLMRMLIMPRRNYPVAIKRNTWKGRGQFFSEYGVQIRCVAEDQTTTTNVLHFVTDGTAKISFTFRKSIYYVPVLLIIKCLCNHTDFHIYKKLLQGYEDDLYFSDCVQNMLRSLHEENLHDSEDCKNYLGKIFRVKFFECPKWYTDSQITDFILRRCVLIHLNDNQDKFNLLTFMIQKLFVFAQDKCRVEGVDTVMMQEVLMGGHLYLQTLKERLQGWLAGLRMVILKRATKHPLTPAEIQKSAKFTGTLENALQNFFATGNLASASGLGLMQDKGLIIVAENINRMRYMSHFRAVHRGAFFQEMRTTEPRQLHPDAWGFICPVHTPDGAPCGLLNHLTSDCKITDVPDRKKLENLPLILVEFGMVHVKNVMVETANLKEYYAVQLDGKIMGYYRKSNASAFVGKLRELKVRGEVPETLEIVLVPMKDVPSQFPGIFLFTGPARMMRPVINLAVNKVELIGTFEQVYLEVAVVQQEIYKGITTHMDISKTSFLSNLAKLIPMPDCNQSPRNMYQCQMGKQTMGTPCHNWNLQAETKLYRLQTPATPLFRPVHYDNVGLDDFAMGTNAIVAVISYTGYDMEDAIVINKWSHERGFAHGSIYKSEFIELPDSASYFCRDPENAALAEHLDTDGLPFVGKHVKPGEPIACYYNAEDLKYVVQRFHGKEECYVDNVRICGTTSVKAPKVACLTFRVPRNASVGDKFASRAGQKGICSQKWLPEDLPFTETGLVPDIIFNPHGFPSRMTIAMMIEIMAGKSASLHGFVHDATPFRFTEDDTAIHYFGRLLEAGGYNYYGNETMYSGIDGREMTAQIFFGVVHYQRLRHMVSDKWQVRSTGPVDMLTRQPVKGRKKGGGVRFGEMERDCLISHGASFLLQDRLFHNSDKTTTLVCTSCGTLLGPAIAVATLSEKPKRTCRLCGNGDNVTDIEIPYIFKFLVAQFASCNINVKIDCKHV